MSNQNRIHLIAIIVIVLLMIVKGIVEHEPTVPLMTEEEKDAAFEEAIEFYGAPKDISQIPFDFDIDQFIDNPTFGLTIDPNECVDTYEVGEVSCADKAAVIEYREALNAIEVERLQKEIRMFDLDDLFFEFGLVEA